ncbi:unnamed protein product [Absidia cylindrospora]
MKRPRAPIACFRCHRKKVRCDGANPFCTRCQSTGSSCSYPSSRRSRNTQPHHVDPYIDHLSQLEHQIRQIEADMNEYRSMLLSSLMTTSMDPTLGNTTTSTSTAATTTTTTAPNGTGQHHPQEDMLRSHLSKTEQEVQESRTILAQLRLRGEQRIARTKRNQTKEAKQQQQRQQHHHHHHRASSSPSSISPINDKKKTQPNTKLHKADPAEPSTSSSSSSSSPYLGIHESSSSATKTAYQKPSMKVYLPTTSTTSSPTSNNTLQHVPSSFMDMNTSHVDSMNLYGTPPPTAAGSSYHHHHTSSGGYAMPPPPPPPPPQQHSSADLYYMTMVGGATTAGPTSGPNTAPYYDPLMDYPWTTPTDFAATGLHSDDKQDATTTTKNGTTETAHYSPSTVAAIEEVTRMAQQMHPPQQP